MKALVYYKFGGPLTVENQTDPTPKTHGVVVKVKATGLCRSDWHGWMGHDQDIVLPHVPGHELAGEIVAKGKAVTRFKLGDRVTVPFVCGCGNCDQCSSGNQQICDYQSQPGFTHWGSFAEYVSLDYADVNLVKLPPTIDDLTAATLGCRFITSFRAVVAQGKVKQGNYVAVHGCGGVGLSAVMIAKALGAHVIAIDINPGALTLAKAFGAIPIRADKSANVVAEIQDISKGGVHVSLDALGNRDTCVHSIQNLRKRGKHIQVGLMAGGDRHPKIPMDLVIANELEILGSHGMQAHAYPQMLQMIASQQLQPQRLITKTLSLQEAASELPNMNSFKHEGVSVINSFI